MESASPEGIPSEFQVLCPVQEEPWDEFGPGISEYQSQNFGITQCRLFLFLTTQLCFQPGKGSPPRIQQHLQDSCQCVGGGREFCFSLIDFFWCSVSFPVFFFF